VIILAADTSLPILSVALMRDETLLGAVALEGKGSRNEKLLPAIDWLLRECAIARDAIELFAATRGPGSFTGVRIGLATLQGIALVLGRPLCALSTHEALLWSDGPPSGRAVVIDDAGRDEFYVSRFDGAELVEGPALATGDLRSIPSGEREWFVPSASQTFNVAVGCARRAFDLARSAGLEAYADVTPIYVRLAEAEVKLQQARAE
jgi:tRNA threonylcarbamoyl adenosine modification protein YeaZ